MNNSFEIFQHYEREQRAKDEMRRRNQNILTRQLFQRAAYQKCIAIHPDHSVEILDLNGAVHHFSHHPELSQQNPELANGLYRSDKELLERGLTRAYREAMQF